MLARSLFPVVSIVRNACFIFLRRAHAKCTPSLLRRARHAHTFVGILVMDDMCAILVSYECRYLPHLGLGPTRGVERCVLPICRVRQDIM